MKKKILIMMVAALAWIGPAKAQKAEHFKYVDMVQCLKKEDATTCGTKHTKYKKLCEKADGITTYAWSQFTQNPSMKISMIAKASKVLETKFIWTTRTFLSPIIISSPTEICGVDILVQANLGGERFKQHLRGQVSHFVTLKDGKVLVHGTVNKFMRDTTE